MHRRTYFFIVFIIVPSIGREVIMTYFIINSLHTHGPELCIKLVLWMIIQGPKRIFQTPFNSIHFNC